MDIREKGKKAGTESRAKAGADKIPNTTPSHPIDAYAGTYETPTGFKFQVL